MPWAWKRWWKRKGDCDAPQKARPMLPWARGSGDAAKARRNACGRKKGAAGAEMLALPEEGASF